ncbi:Protein ALTERED XYLOGLUCAN 4 [Ananas comosus]|uniref:Protein ALTERED XYLOGLUCAN 4 n=1 Tax=Ananas comosus TaxID=4615 RepID=A0A199UZ86_ANACO|nr:Protein ALTERED XYLOGLUCAN 4 [Ananas comosus]
MGTTHHPRHSHFLTKKLITWALYALIPLALLHFYLFPLFSPHHPSPSPHHSQNSTHTISSSHQGLYIYIYTLALLINLLPAAPARRVTATGAARTDEFGLIRRRPRCDYAEGRWVRDAAEPLYNCTSCRTIKDSRNCMAHGRPDTGYLYWRWKPKHCTLPPFDPASFLTLLKNTHLAMIGDSLARNQLESLLCLLATSSRPELVYSDGEVDKFPRWVFLEYNATVSAFWSPFLVRGVERTGAAGQTHNVLYLDSADARWASNWIRWTRCCSVRALVRVPVRGDAVLGTHHFPELNHTEIGFFAAFRMAIRRALREVVDAQNRSGGGAEKEKLVVVTTFRRRTSRGVDKAGACPKKEPFGEGEKEMDYTDKEMRKIEVEEVAAASAAVAERGAMLKIKVLDVTELAWMRPDGHPGPYMRPNPFAEGPKKRVQNDCVHWCLPGPVDAWNEILLERMKIWKEDYYGHNPQPPPQPFPHQETHHLGSLCPHPLSPPPFLPLPPLLPPPPIPISPHSQTPSTQSPPPIKQQQQVSGGCGATTRRGDGFGTRRGSCTMARGAAQSRTARTAWRTAAPTPAICTGAGAEALRPPRFDPASFLTLLKGRHLAMVGDSMARNQLESLLCLLATASRPELVYRDGDENKFRRWVFREHNATVSVFWSPFLVRGVEKSAAAAAGLDHNELHLDSADERWASELDRMDAVLFSVGHWFLHPAVYYEGDALLGCHHCPGLNHTEIGFFGVFRKAIRRALREVVDAEKEKLVVVTTFSPAHFEGSGQGRACPKKEPFGEGEKEMEYTDKEMRKIELEEAAAAAAMAKAKGGRVKIEALDVTELALMRPDGHPGPYMYPNPFAEGPKERVQNDCVHWCLPGPIDAWNEILLDMMKRWKEDNKLIAFEFMDGAEDVCDLSVGKWVKEPRGPLYNNATCRTLPDLKDCMKYGKEPSYLYWRWKPEGCELPRFDPETFLAVVRGKKMGFIGDSLARNQMESLLCLLSQRLNRRIQGRRRQIPNMHFPPQLHAHGHVDEFFVEGIQRIVNGTATASYDIHLDKINTNWTSRLPGLDFAVISGGNWFFRTHYLYEGGKTVGCLNCGEDNVRDLGVEFAVRSVVRKALEFVSTCAECDGLVTFLRTYTPSHFENGSWFTGGTATELNLEKIQFEEMERARRTKVNGPGREFGLLDVTKAMMLRRRHRGPL